MSCSTHALELAGVALDAPGPRLHVDGLTVPAGEVVAVCGPNGAGKSTLLKVLAGDLRPTRGRALLGGDDVRSLSTGELARRRAVMTQDSSVAFPFTVLEVVAMGRAPWRPADDDLARVEHAMASVGIAHLAGRRVTSLSGGERARTALARVLVQDCDVLLLDEPTAALDLRHQHLLAELLRDRAGSGRTSVVVLHDLALAAATATRVVLVRDGGIIADGPPGHVICAPTLSSAFAHPIDVLHHERVPTPIVVPRHDLGHTTTQGATTTP